MTPSLSSKFEESNHALAAPVRDRLTAICADPPLHVRFLNMLSLLEHIGSRKIMTSPALAAPDSEALKHLAEEARHAVFFKRAAERMAARPLDYAPENTLVEASARLYMGKLDVEISRKLGTAIPALAYLYMSLIVELRAVWLYRIYQRVLSEQNTGVSLKSVLAEEELHLRAMFARLSELDRNVESRIAQFCASEEALFRHLWSEIEGACAVPRLAAE